MSETLFTFGRHEAHEPHTLGSLHGPEFHAGAALRVLALVPPRWVFPVIGGLVLLAVGLCAGVELGSAHDVVAPTTVVCPVPGTVPSALLPAECVAAVDR